MQENEGQKIWVEPGFVCLDINSNTAFGPTTGYDLDDLS
jgi:hypothetical protein